MTAGSHHQAPGRHQATSSGWRVLLLDVGGVIAHRDVAGANRRLATIHADLTIDEVQAVCDGAALYPSWEAYSCGRLSPEEYWGAVLESLGLPATPERIGALREVQQATSWACLDEAVLKLVGRLRSGGRLRLGVLSNSAPEHEAQISRFEHLFDVARFSHRTGLRKPAPAAYLAAAHDLGELPEAIVFVDDKPRNIEPAAALGMRALHFRGAPALAEELVEMQLLTDSA